MIKIKIAKNIGIYIQYIIYNTILLYYNKQNGQEKRKSGMMHSLFLCLKMYTNFKSSVYE